MFEALEPDVSHSLATPALLCYAGSAVGTVYDADGHPLAVLEPSE